jgi:hypothetical protein
MAIFSSECPKKYSCVRTGHAYNYELDITRLKNLLKVVEGLKNIYLNDIDKFLQNIL